MKMKTLRKFGLFLSIASCVGMIQGAQMVCAKSSDDSTKMAPLQAQIEHDETLPPVPSDMQIGKPYDTSLQSLTPGNEWFQLPTWFGGTWHSDEQTILSLHDYSSGKTIKRPMKKESVSDVTYGMQTDKTGQVWNYVKIPQVQKHTSSDGVAYLQTSQEELVKSDDTGLVLKYLYSQIQLNDKNEIDSVQQIQSINTYTPLDDGLVRLHASLKSFDENGKAVVIQVGEQMMKRTSPYKEKDSDGKLDLKSLFAEYLKSHGQQDLVPN